MTAFDPFIGETFEGRYTICNVIGTGGMATVYGAYDIVTGRSVAIKMMNKKLEHNPRQIKLFINESTALSLLSHPNIVQVYSTAITNSTKYIIMEYVEGITLKKHIDHRGALPEREVLYYATQILSALDYIHSKNIVHCDIKPQNIILLQSGSIKVADFGIARLDAMLDKSKEKSDVALGTVYYVSPEQAQGKAPRAESDIYSLGVMLYEAMTDRLPFYHENATEVAKMQISKDPLPPSFFRPDISIGLEQIILRAMEKNPKKRYANAQEMLTDIRALRQNSKTVFGNEKNSSRYRVIERKPYTPVPNISNRAIQSFSEKGASFVEHQGAFKRTTSHSGTFKPKSERIPQVKANTSSDRTVRIPSSELPHVKSQRLPKTEASNTTVMDENMNAIKRDRESNLISVLLGIILALVLVLLISFFVWISIFPADILGEEQIQTLSQTVKEWNIEHTVKF